MMLAIINAPKLSTLTTIRLGGKAVALIDVPSVESLEALPQTLQRLGGVALPFGRGSNILAADDDLNLTLIRMAQTDTPHILPSIDVEDTVRVHIPTSMKLPRLLTWCAKNGLSGLQGLAGIPGHVGGALAMNAGSFGTEFCAHLESIRYFTLRDGLQTSEASQCTWGYRHFAVASKTPVILYIDLIIALTKASTKSIQENMKGYIAKKTATQPTDAYSAGCVFKNPHNAPAAGKLLDDAGFRGKVLGGMSFSSKHANFLVNSNKGTAAQAFELIHTARERVATLAGIHLETEIRVLPCQ